LEKHKSAIRLHRIRTKKNILQQKSREKENTMKQDPDKTPAKTVDEYLAAIPPEAQAVLEQLRSAIKAAAPEAEEMISYQIPTYKYHGPLVHFVARRNHYSFIAVSSAVLETFKNELKDYAISGTTIHFTAGHPPPAALIEKIVKARIRENEERAGKK
jgi:uncharacterized protein YdhG (YjbR/CyaY superfamily)